MTNDDKIREEILQYVINREGANKSALSYGKIRCVKRVHIRSYSGPHFSHIFPHSEWMRRHTPYLSVFIPNSGKCGKNANQNNSEYDTFYAVIDKYEYLTGEEILLPDQSRMMEQTKFTYSPFGKEFERQIKTIEGPEEKQMKSLEKHGKRLVKSGSEKYFLKLSKLKEIFDELTNEMIDEIKNLSRKTDFNNWTNYIKSENCIGFKAPLSFLKKYEEWWNSTRKSRKMSKKKKKK